MPAILFSLIVFIVLFHYKSRHASRMEKKQSEEFWKREHEASFARNKDISQLDYIEIPFQELPFCETTEEPLFSLQNTIRELSNQKICNLTGQSNTDLKLTYGPMHLHELSEYDHNFTILARTLHNLGTYYYEQKDFEKAQQIFEFAVKCNSDVSKTYLFLAKIYHSQKNLAKITELIAAANELNTLLKKSLIRSLTEILNTPLTSDTESFHNLE